MKERHLVSIITPLYNSKEFIVETIKSVLLQTYQNWEMIIVDDVSSDNSCEIVDTFSEEDNRIKLVKLDVNSGAAAARNKAIQMANGKYIAFLDSDDLWHPNKLDKQISFMEKNKLPFTFTSYQKINEEGSNFLGRGSAPNRVNYRNLLKTNVIGCLTAIYDTESFEKVLMPSIRKRQDFGLWLKLLKRTEYAYGLDENLATYRVRTNSISSNKLNTMSSIWYLYRKVEELSVSESIYYCLHYSVKGVFRKIFISQNTKNIDETI